MADIENLLADSSTAPADPSRHGFLAWRERFLIAHLTANNPDTADGDVAEGVARADGEQGSRVRFLWWWTLLELVAFVVFTILLAVEPSDAGPAVYNAAMVVGFAGMVVVVCSGSLLIHLWNSVIEGNRAEQRIIDSLM